MDIFCACLLAGSSGLPSADLFRAARSGFNAVALRILGSSGVNVSIVGAQAVFFQRASSF